MATFLLSISEHVVLSHALGLRTLARLKVDSSSPNRLTQWGPLTAFTRQALLLAEEGLVSTVRSLRVRAV